MEQGYNYLDGSIQAISEFFENRIQKLEPTAVSTVSRKSNKKPRNKKSSKKRKATTFKDSEEESSEEEKTDKKRFCKFHSMCTHTTDECAILKTLIKQAKNKRPKLNKKKKYTQLEVNVLVQKKVKQVVKNQKKKSQTYSKDLNAFTKMEISDSESESSVVSSIEEDG